MKKVYIASPYTKGDVAVNVRIQIDVADKLMTLGFIPFVPLLCHFQHMIHPRSYADWLIFGRDWVLCCDAILRLPGESAGADDEVKLAKHHNIPVFYSIGELLAGNIK